ncbi:MAG: nitrogenase cofactor biosynthesis protein NifB [Desulfovibrionaceae bacterium]|jgi:nitrogen fixation protein NifB|nr:nitrogenase cofactor biosynthesis protein NifB [Desulfovibrionaceae bacterium]
MTTDRSKHPCFNKSAAGDCGRVHLPVAPKCNIQCNYCNRRYDCVNESRPGVTSAVLNPEQAVEYMDKVLEAEPRITVAGIAGPGDPMANAAETLRTMRLIREKHPELLFCLSSNGLALPEHVDEIAAVGVSHVTVTMNFVDPAIGEKIYSFVRDGKVVYRGRQAAELLLSRQREAIRLLKEKGILVKVNTIVIPGINEEHVLEVAREARRLGADIQNLIPIKPTEGTPFGDLDEPAPGRIKELRAAAGVDIDQMTHCKRCRADAVGLLSNDLSGGALGGCLRACAAKKVEPARRPYVAVASREGLLVNQHLGEAQTLQIWEQAGDSFRLVEERETPNRGSGPKRWLELAKTLDDCRAVLSAAVGETPTQILREHGTEPYAVSGLIEAALAAVYGSGDVNVLRARRAGACGGSACSGGGGGCG